MAFDASSKWFGWEIVRQRARAFLQVTTKGGDAGVNGSGLPGVGWAQVVALTNGVADSGPLGTSADPLVVSAGATVKVTPVAGTVSKVTTGGTAVTAITGPINGGFLRNPVNAARQKIATAEPLYYDMVGVPGSTEAAANGTTDALDPGDVLSIPPLATGVTLQVNAATSSHAFSIEVW